METFSITASRKLKAHEITVIGSSDDEEQNDAEVSFIGSSRAIRPMPRSIVIASESDSDEERLLDLDTILKRTHSSIPKPTPPITHDADREQDHKRSLAGPSSSNSNHKPAKRPKSSAKTKSISPDDTRGGSDNGPIYDDTGSIPTAPARKSKEEREADKQREKQERQVAKATAKAAKEADKSFQKKVTEVNRLKTSKNETVREIRLYMSADMALPVSPIAGALPEINARYKESLSEIHYLNEDDSPVPGVIRIKRHIKAQWDITCRRFIPLEDAYWEWEDVIMIIVGAEDIVDKIVQGHGKLIEWIHDCRILLGLKSSCQIIIIIRDLGKYRAKTRTLANREFTALARAGLQAGSSSSTSTSAQQVRPTSETIDYGLVEMQVEERVFVVEVEKTEEMEDWVWNLSADVALRPYKLLSKSHLSFAPTDQKRKATSPTDALELMLQEVQGVTASAAAGIAAEYPTFAELMRAYQKAEGRGGETRAEGMLEECQIKNLKNGTASGRKLNKALSKRVYQVFRGRDSLALA